MELKKGVSVTVGGRTLKKEITETGLKLLKDHIEKVNIGIEKANKKDGKKRVLKSLSDFLKPKPKTEAAPQEKAAQEIPKSK